MKGIFLSSSLIRSLSSLGNLAFKPAHISAYGLGLCLLLALSTPPTGGHKAQASRAPAGERVAYDLKLDDAAMERVANWNKFAASGTFTGPEAARALGALGNSKRIVAAFEDMGYRLDRLRDGYGTVPRVYLEALPADLSEVESIDLRKAMFIKAVLPLVLRVNEEILDRREILQVYARKAEAGRPLGVAEIALIDETAELYGVKALDRAVALRELLRRVDVVPPSLALTQAALESGWGTSRFAQEGNALFGQKAFSDSVKSLASRRAKPGQDVERMRSFDSLLSAVRSYAHNLNSHQAYGEFRAQRAELRRKNEDGALDSDLLARTLLRYSERGLSYTADLRQLMRTNGMRMFDEARLEADSRAIVASRAPNDA